MRTKFRLVNLATGILLTLSISFAFAEGLTGTDVEYTPMPRQITQPAVGLSAIVPSFDFGGIGCSPCGEISPQIEGRILPAVRSFSQCSDLVWVRNIIRYLTTDRYVDIDGPEGLNFVTYLNSEDIIKTPYPFYRGWDISGGSGCFEIGTRISGVLVMESQKKFNPSDLCAEWYTTDGGNIFSATQNGFSDFSGGLVGYSWGQDGLKNTPDDIEYRSGSAHPVNELYYTGVWGASNKDIMWLKEHTSKTCYFVVFHYWLVENGVTRFDETIKVPIGYTFPGWIEIQPSDYQGYSLVGVDPGGFSGFLYQSSEMESWELVKPEPFESGWYYIEKPKGQKTFYRLEPDIYLR